MCLCQEVKYNSRATSFSSNTNQELSISLDPLTDCRTFSSTNYSTVSGRESVLIKQSSPAILGGPILEKACTLTKSTAVIASDECALANLFDLLNDISIWRLNCEKYADYFGAEFNLGLVNHSNRSENVLCDTFNIKQ